jgi:hypothetical protein
MERNVSCGFVPGLSQAFKEAASKQTEVWGRQAISTVLVITCPCPVLHLPKRAVN